MGETKHIPEGYHTITPYLIVDKAEELVEFVRKAFGAVEKYRMSWPDGGIAHAELKIGDSVFMLSEARGEMKAMPVTLYIYTEDVDAAYQRALEAGGESVMKVENQFYGDRSGGVRDPSGNNWWIATHVEDVSEEEMKRRQDEWLQQQGQSS